MTEPSKIRIVVTGWRFAQACHRPDVEDALSRASALVQWGDDDVARNTSASGYLLVHGAAPGVDTIAAAIAKDWGWEQDPHPADWQHQGKAAGPFRNRLMIALGAQIVVGLPGPESKGTWDCLKVASAALIPCYVQPLRDPGDNRAAILRAAFPDRISGPAAPAVPSTVRPEPRRTSAVPVRPLVHVLQR
jgi:YspA, cpYpsA-related SLOG family